MRSVVAILAGFVTLSILLYVMQGAGTAVMLRMNPDLPATASLVTHSNGTRVFWLVWETMSMVAAGYMTARLASTSRLAHALIMSAIQAVFTVGAMFSVRGDEPLWFWIIGSRFNASAFLNRANGSLMGDRMAT